MKILALLILFTCVTHRPWATERNGKNANLIADSQFSDGFIVEAPNKESSEGGGKRIEGTRTTPWSKNPPVWHLAQWNSKRSVEPKFVRTPPTLAEWKNNAKTISIGEPGSEEEGIETVLNATFENGPTYDADKLKKAWPHLLLRQMFRDTQVHVVSLGELSHLNFSAQYKLTFARPVPNAGVGHYMIFFAFQNRNKKHEQPSLGLAIYDNRYDKIKRWVGEDHDQHKLLFLLGDNDNYLAGDPHSQQWIDLSLDLIPKIKEMLDYGLKKGVLSSGNIADYDLVGLTLNWEAPGLGIFGSKIRHLSMVAEKGGS